MEGADQILVYADVFGQTVHVVRGNTETLLATSRICVAVTGRKCKSAEFKTFAT